MVTVIVMRSPPLWLWLRSTQDWMLLEDAFIFIQQAFMCHCLRRTRHENKVKTVNGNFNDCVPLLAQTQ